jgi:hypothetical protein
MKNVAASFDLESGIDATMTFQVASEADATSAKAGIDGMIPMLVSFGVPSEVVSAIRTEARGSIVNLSILLSLEQAMKLQAAQ